MTITYLDEDKSSDKKQNTITYLDEEPFKTNVSSNKQEEITTSSLGAFGAAAGEGVGMARGALAGGRALMAVTPPVLPFVGPLAKPIAGIVGGIGGGILASSGITSLEQFADTVFGTKIVATREAQKRQNPIATKSGYIAGMSLNPWLRPMLPKTVGEGVAMGAVGVGIGAGMRAIEGQPILDPKELAIDAITGAFIGPTARGRTALGLPQEQVKPVIGDTTKLPTSAETDASKRIEANLREAELSTSSGKRLKEAAFMDTETGEYIPQGKSHDEMLKTDPKLIQGFLTEDNSFVTREEAAIIAKEQHADKLVEEIDPKQGLRSSNFGPERLDALKPKDLIFYKDKLKELIYKKRSLEELLDQDRNWDVEIESIKRQEKYIAKLQEQINETQKLHDALEQETETPNIVRDKRVVEADILRTIAEQQKRSRLLGNDVELAAYAKDKGIFIEEMRKVLKNNFITNEIYLKKYQEEIKTAPSANTSDIKFTDKNTNEELKSASEQLGIRTDTRKNFYEDLDNKESRLAMLTQEMENRVDSMSTEEQFAANKEITALEKNIEEARKDAPAFESKGQQQRRIESIPPEQRTLEEEQDLYALKQLGEHDSRKLDWEDTQDLLRGAKTATEALQRIVDGGHASWPLIQLAKLLIKNQNLADARIILDENSKPFPNGKPDEFIVGEYDPVDHAIGMFKDGNIQTFLHENIHAAVYALQKEGTHASAIALKKLYEDYKSTVSKQKQKDIYGLTDELEFLAEAFTNPKFQKLLNTRYMLNNPSKTMWQGFKDIVKDSLGIKKKDQAASALDQVLDHGAVLIEEGFVPSERTPTTGSKPVLSVVDLNARRNKLKAEATDKRMAELLGSLSPEDLDILQNDRLDTGSIKSRIPSELKDDFKEWRNELGVSETDMAWENLYETESKFLQEVAENKEVYGERASALADFIENRRAKINVTVPSKGSSFSSDSVGSQDYERGALKQQKEDRIKIQTLYKEVDDLSNKLEKIEAEPATTLKEAANKNYRRLNAEKEWKAKLEELHTLTNFDPNPTIESLGGRLAGLEAEQAITKATMPSKGTVAPTPAVDPTRYDPRKVTDEADLKLKGKELYASKGADAAREFFTGYEKYKETWVNPVKEVEDFVEMNINNKMADERIVINNSNDLKALLPDAVAREQVAIAIDAKKTDTLTGAAKEAADKYTGLMKDIGERALKEGVVRGLLENYVTHIVNWADMPKGALETFLNETLGTGSSPRDPGVGMTPESRFGKERKVETFAQLDRVLGDINRRIALAGKDFKLEVKTKDIAEIYKEYASSMEKAIENKKLIDSVLSIRNPNGESLVRRVTAEEPLPYGWQMIKDRQFAGYAVHPDLAPALKFAFEAQGNKVLNAIYSVSQVTKRLNVIGSLFHAKSLMEVLSSAHTPIITPLKEIALGVTDKLLGTEYSGIRKAINEFEKGGLGSSVDKWQRGGLVLEVPSDVSKGIISATGKFADSMIGKFGPKTRILESALSATEKYTLGVFDKITWDYLHTGGKLMTAEAYLSKARENAAKEGKPFDETAARKEIVSFVNKSFGGLNWFQEARPSRTPGGALEQASNIVSQTYKKFSDQMAMAAYSPEGRKGLQIMLFAPDWTISTIKAFTAALPKELNPTKWHPIEGIKGMATPSTKADYARLYQFKTALTYLTLINGINLAVSGRNVWENKDPTRIEYPDGTSMQAMKHAMEPYHWISDPDKTLTNKLGFVPKAVAVGVTGLEYASPYAPKMVDPSAVNRAKAIASMALPFQASAAISAPKGEGVNRALLGTIGLPVYGQTKEQRKVTNQERAKQTRELREQYKQKTRERGY